ncbi:MAG: LTA synthase family protein [Bacteroidetes bacterium]|nr:LTA synthase family protein [Bacteroidota bacterium]MCL2301634.1 LTA synthase family protein [Lentimicrobiaceae bacterium]
MKKKIALFLSRAVIFCKSYIELCIWLLIFAVALRLFEAILLNQVNHHSFVSNLQWNLTGLGYDIFLFLRTGFWILVLFVAACFLNEKISRLTLRILLSLMLFLSLICIVFFATSGFLLDKVVFTYSLKEMWYIIRSSGKSPLWIYMIMIALPVLYFYLSGKRIKINNTLLVIFASLTLFSFFIFNKPPTHTQQYLVKVNKQYFFLQSVFKTQNPLFKENNKEINKAVKEFRAYFPEHKFAEVEYPFLYQATYKDVLSPYFNLKPEPPNLVFIIVEGLGYDFFKTDYQLMPFLDSLSKQSLLWEYCLSVSARTFGVLPALFGASPLGDKGFTDQYPNNPEFHSLLRILHQNNYTNHFFYGGWVNFDNMGYFAHQNNMTYLNDDEWDQDIKDESAGPRGYEDHLVYLQALRKLNQINTAPRIDVYLSNYTHLPFIYPNSSHFQNVVKNNVIQNKTLSDQEKKEILNSLDSYGSFVYADWALRQLMEGYQKRDDFDNTIFIITGDHNLPAKQFGGYANYHVPLMIYSPMLKTVRKMKGVVSHRDITPTILSLLQNNYNIQTPNEVAWLNTALDTSLTFNAKTFSPLQLIDHTIGGIVYNNYLLCEGVLEELTDNGPRKVNDPHVLQQMNRLLSLYRSLDYYAFYNNALLRNHFAYKYNSANTIFDIEDTIAPGSYFAERSGLQVTEGPEGHKTTLYFDTSSLYPIEFLNFDIPKETEEFRVEVEFRIYIINDVDRNFDVEVVMDLSEKTHEGANVMAFKRDNIEIFHQNKWFTYKNTLTYKKEQWEAAENECYFKLYLWNLYKLEGYVDDIKIKMKVLNQYN